MSSALFERSPGDAPEQHELTSIQAEFEQESSPQPIVVVSSSQGGRIEDLNIQELAPVDRGLQAWRFCFSAFILEMMVWGFCFRYAN